MATYPKRTVTVPVNAAISVANTSTELIPAATTSDRTTLIRNKGDRTIYLAYGEAATTAKEPLNVGEIRKSGYLGAINAITASGTGTAHVVAEAR